MAKKKLSQVVLTNKVAPTVDTTKTPGELAAAIIARASKKSATTPEAVQTVAAAHKTARRSKTRPALESETASPAQSTTPAAGSTETPSPKPKKDKSRDCECGCGGRTKGGRYLPGHDSKHRAAQAGPKEMPECGCGCGVRTKGGRFLPGHDAKFHSAQKKAAKEAEKAQAEQAKAA